MEDGHEYDDVQETTEEPLTNNLKSNPFSDVWDRKC